MNKTNQSQKPITIERRESVENRQLIEYVAWKIASVLCIEERQEIDTYERLELQVGAGTITFILRHDEKSQQRVTVDRASHQEVHELSILARGGTLFKMQLGQRGMYQTPETPNGLIQTLLVQSGLWTEEVG